MDRSCCCSTGNPTASTLLTRQRMLGLVREIAASGVRIILSSHLLRDVENCCDEVIVLKDGKVATIANLAAERASQRRFLELETRGGENGNYPRGRLAGSAARLPSCRIASSRSSCRRPSTCASSTGSRPNRECSCACRRAATRSSTSSCARWRARRL